MPTLNEQNQFPTDVTAPGPTQLLSHEEPPPIPPSAQQQFIPINPIEELLKAIGIVHGKRTEIQYRHILSLVEDGQKKALKAASWTGDRIQHMLDTEISYKDWKFIVQERTILTYDKEHGSRKTDIDLRLRAEWPAPDAGTGQMEKQQSRWWPLSKHMVKTEIIQTALKCVFVAEEHEIREAFKYKGKAPFNTHIDVDTLVAVSEKVDVRTDTRPEAPANQRRE